MLFRNHHFIFVSCLRNQHYIISLALEISMLSSFHALETSSVICPCPVRFEIYLIGDRLDVL
jgi:hypothetical protein